MIACTPVQGYSGTVWQRQLDAETRLSVVVVIFCREVCLTPESCALSCKGTSLSEHRTVQQVRFGRFVTVKAAYGPTARSSCTRHGNARVPAEQVQTDVQTAESLEVEATVHISIAFYPGFLDQKADTCTKALTIVQHHSAQFQLMEQTLLADFIGDAAQTMLKSAELAAILPTAAISIAGNAAPQLLTCQQHQLLQPQMLSCLLRAAHSLIYAESATMLHGNSDDESSRPAEDTVDIWCILCTSLVIVKAAVLAVEVHNQNADDLSARAQLWMSVHAAARRLHSYAVKTAGAPVHEQTLSGNDATETEATTITSLLVQLLLPALRLSLGRSALPLESNTCRICCHVLHAMLAQRSAIAHVAATKISNMGKHQPLPIHKSSKQAVICAIW